MLILKDIKKDYKTAGSTVHALKGVSLRFRQNEFVSILGASGCGKTTLLNIIGGLDHYTQGDLVICGKSTKDYKDKDWDVYRNHRIGFVFQAYNLIPHQTVLGNVELSLTIAGLPKAERRARAKDALCKVGLEKELHKRPNQLSGGQMQRVAIARALVNNPEILLADEPTGALDTETSIQIMDLIREIAKERLVIMVTHNPEIAEEYSTRIVRLKDGLVISDSNPCTDEESQTWTEQVENVQTATPNNKPSNKKDKPKKEKSAMSFATSLGLSARNLLTKKGRTAITSVAGSIGIISVCLVLALSNGFNTYIKKTQEDMLSSAPLEITETTLDTAAIITGMTSATDIPDLSKIGDQVYVNSFLTNIAHGMTVTNDLSSEYLQYLESMDSDWYSALVYDTGMRLNYSLYTDVEIENDSGSTERVVLSLAELKEYYTLKLTQQEAKYANLAYLVDYLGEVYGKIPGTTDVTSAEFGQYVLTQYDVIKGEFPTSANEAVLVVGGNNDVTDLTLAQLGFIGEKQFLNLFPQAGETTDDVEDLMIPFNQVIGKKFMLNYNDAIYTTSTGSTYMYDYKGKRSVEQFDIDPATEDDGVEVTITGVLRLKDGLTYGCLGSGLFLTEELYENCQAVNKQSALAQTLRTQTTAVEQFNVLTKALSGLDSSSQEYQNAMQALTSFFIANMSNFKRATETVESYYMSGASMAGESTSDAMATFLKNCYFLYGDTAVRMVGGLDKVNAIQIYTDSFANKDLVVKYLDTWNDTHEEAKKVQYTDTVGMMMKMVETMLNAVTYVLVAFTAISLVVSSVMIGIITYVSVVERTKEIGVLRSLGARKKDIKNLFNAETFIIGLTSGLFGVAVTYLICLAVNAILGTLTGLYTLASLPVLSAFIMVCVSVVLTLISGLIPAKAAANKDPVIALRSE